MNKKIVITLLAVLLFAALLPLIGNQGISSAIENRIALLEENGLKVETQSESTYMQTKSSYVISIKDSEKFIAYLNTLSKSQVPPYVEALVDDTKVGIDTSYSNVPLFSDISVDIFPISLSDEINADILADDPIFHKQLTTILDKKMLVYHIDYAISSMSFKGYIKNIDENLTFKDGSSVHMVLNGSSFKGEGTLMEPTQIESKIKLISIYAVDAAGAVVDAKIEKLSSANVFDSINDYKLALMIGDFELNLKQGLRKAKIEFEDLEFSYVSQIRDEFMNLKSTIALDEIEVEGEGQDFSAKNLVYDISLNKLDKEEAEKIQELSYKLQYSPAGQATMLMSDAVVALLEKGLAFDINTFSVDSFSLGDKMKLKGFNHDLHLILKPDSQFKQKLANPMALMSNIDLNSKLSFQKELYEFLQKQSPQGVMLDQFSKKEGDNIVFDIVIKDQKLSVNGKQL